MVNRAAIANGTVSSSSEQYLGNLDFLRGCAAFYVVLFHFSSRVYFAGFMYHGYLAVDFFFCLSGVVIYRSYFSKITKNEMSFKDFIWSRIIRLMPLVILGNVIAAIIDLSRPGNFSFSHHLKDIISTFSLGSLLLPTFFRTTLEDGTYPLNGPIWSLSFELFANIVFFFASISNINSILFSLFYLISAIAMIIAISILGNAHFGPHIETFYLGFFRVFVSFFMGVMIERYNLKRFIFNRWISAAILFVITLMPDFHSFELNSYFDIAVIIFVIPILISTSSVENRQLNDKFAEMSGRISYPLYCMHYPIIRVTSNVIRHFRENIQINVFICVIISAFLSLASWFIFKFYDVPVRKFLRSQKWFGTGASLRKQSVK